MQENHIRSIVKGATWRMIGTMDTIMLSFLFTHHIGKALSIGGIELFTKIFLFWAHERVWMRLDFGKDLVTIDGQLIKQDKHYRSIIKGISWRVIGSMDTFWIALFINRESPHPTQIALMIAVTEVLTKVALFWLHERVWMRVKWGIVKGA